MISNIQKEIGNLAGGTMASPSGAGGKTDSSNNFPEQGCGPLSGGNGGYTTLGDGRTNFKHEYNQ